MTAKEQRFIEEYCVDCKGAQAAIRAGYAKSRARQTACDLLKKPEIKKAIRKHQKELTITAAQATKNLSDIARTRVNDFMVIKKVLHRPMVRKPLKEIIAKLKEEIEFENEYLSAVELEENELKRQKVKIKGLEQSLIRLEIELRRNPKAYRDIEGEAEWIERAELDLVAIARAKDVGNVFELSFTEFGPKVKMYAADKANETLLKMKGKLIDRQDHTTKGESLNKGFYGFLKKVNKK
ncbi:hypothetical protein GCM10027592_29400 [Spirosoma flavus]